MCVYNPEKEESSKSEAKNLSIYHHERRVYKGITWRRPIGVYEFVF
jgi:hypothetical protein